MVILHPESYPLGRIQVQMGVDVVDVLPSHQVDPAKVMMAESKELIEGAVDAAAVRAAITRRVLVKRPHGGIERGLGKVVAASCDGRGGDDLLAAALAELQHPFQVP